MKFRTKILRAGKTATGIEIPAKIVEDLGRGKRPPVRVTLNGYTFRSTVAVMGGKFMVGVSADVRAEAGAAGGDVLDVDIALDDKPRAVELPKELKSALTKAKCLAVFEALSPSKRKEMVRQVNDAKAPETRGRRISKIVADLK